MDNWKQWSPEELEKQLSPSQWHPTKSPTVVIEEYFEATSTAAKLAKDTIPSELEIVFNSNENVSIQQQLDLYGTDLPEDSPIAVLIHGGCWQMGSKDDMAGFAVSCHESGVRVVTVGYTLAPKGTIPQMVKELKGAIEWLAARYNKAKIILIGHSAGAHLAGSLIHGASHPLGAVVGIIFIAGLFDLRPIIATSTGTVLNLDYEQATKLSWLLQEFNASGCELKYLVAVGDCDCPYSQGQSRLYYDKLFKIFPGRSEYWIAEGDDHFTVIQNLSNPSAQSSQRLIKFILHYV